uniref:Golgi SNAP receptor complex member 1 n=1 Tax=Physcomitrium patens TaxID=3218 RepID=A0A7I4AJB0_PHYPA
MEDCEGGWEELRKEARKIEGDLDVKLSSYAKLGGMLSHGGDARVEGSWKSMDTEIELLLEKLLDINDSMSRCVAAATSTTSVTQKLARHRDILHEFTQASGSSSPAASLLRERGAIHGNIAHMDEVITIAHTTKVALGAQRTTFMEIQGKVKQLGDRFPAIRGVLGAIKRKKSKDTLILAGVITACILFLIIYWLSK